MSGGLPAWSIGPLWVDVIIALTVAEGVALWLWRRRRGSGPAPAEWLPNLLSGLCLMLALRGALAGWAGLWILACLAASGAIHGTDLVRRWR